MNIGLFIGGIGLSSGRCMAGSIVLKLGLRTCCSRMGLLSALVRAGVGEFQTELSSIMLSLCLGLFTASTGANALFSGEGVLAESNPYHALLRGDSGASCAITCAGGAIGCIGLVISILLSCSRSVDTKKGFEPSMSANILAGSEV